MSIPAAPAEQPLEQRYARSTVGRRLLVWVIGPLVVGLVVLLGWAAWNQAHPDVRQELRSWQRVDAHRVTYEIAVNRRTGASVACDLTVQAADHTKVAETTVTVPAGEPGITVQTGTIRTERAGDAVSLGACHLRD